jgi:hypothetical protein
MSQQRPHDARFVIEVHFRMAQEDADGRRVFPFGPRPEATNEEMHEAARDKLVPFGNAIDRPSSQEIRIV